jgi:hypothetical protein
MERRAEKSAMQLFVTVTSIRAMFMTSATHFVIVVAMETLRVL